MPGMQTALISLHATKKNGHVLIEPTLMAVLSTFRQDKKVKPEAGGILLGYRRDPHLHVVDATFPGPGDRAMRTGFWRSGLAHQQMAYDRWQSSGRTLDYVGEWHTHPQLVPSPSTIDLIEWEKIATSKRHVEMIFLILGLDRTIWLGISEGSSIRRIKPIDTSNPDTSDHEQFEEMN